MNRILRCCVFVALLSSCSSPAHSERRQWMLEKDTLKVLATTEQVAYLVRLVGKDHVSLYTLIPPSSDPHTYQVRRGDGELFSQAELVFFSGLGLEHTASFLKFIELSKAILVGDAIKNKRPQELLTVGKSKDPHMWMDASLWSTGIDVVESALSQARPELAQQFAQNAKSGKEHLLALHQTLQKSIQQLDPSLRYLVTTHDAFRYFTRAYLATDEERASGAWSERCRAPEGIAPDSQMSLYELGTLVEYIESHHIPILFSEYGVTRDSLNRLVDVCFENGLSVRLAKEPLYSDTQGTTGGYEEMLLQDVHSIVEELYGR